MFLYNESSVERPSVPPDIEEITKKDLPQFEDGP